MDTLDFCKVFLKKTGLWGTSTSLTMDGILENSIKSQYFLKGTLCLINELSTITPFPFANHSFLLFINTSISLHLYLVSFLSDVKTEHLE